MGNSKDLQQRVTALLQQGRLKQAIDMLAGFITADSDWQLYTRLTEIQTSYNYMLEYLRKGMPDPNRLKLYRSLMGECYILNDEWAMMELMQEPQQLYSRYRRTYGNSTDAHTLHKRLSANEENRSLLHMVPSPENDKANNSLIQQHEYLLREIFYRLWTSCGWKSSDCEEVFSIITDRTLRLTDRATLVSAITLGLLKCFEPQKAILLCRIAQEEETLTAVRALVGLIIVLMYYESRIECYPELLYALQSLNDCETITQRIRTIQIQLLRCRETQKIDRKMREEIIPAMMKNPHLNSGKLGMEVIKEIDEEEQNPEWKDWIKNDEIKEKLDEMAKWQIEGADVYMSTFSQLKRFPFFEEMCNWFRPFDLEVPEVAEIIPKERHNSKNLLNAICASRFFCNSDKYSFCLTFKQVPREQREMMQQQIADNGGSDGDGPDTMNSAYKEREAETMSNQYIQDLYRFFKLSRHRKEFTDPFSLSLNMLESRHLLFLIDHPESMLRMFHYLIEKEYYTEAFHAGTMLEERSMGNLDAEFYQKMGYCLQKSGDCKKAVEYYTKADIIAPDSLWTMRHIAQCYRLMGDFESALHYYTATEAVAPENRSLLLQTGECLAALKRYDEAFERFFKVEYIDSESIRSWRAIAWCSFLTGNYAQARHYYAKLMQHPKAGCEDFMNAAHVEWIDDKRDVAFSLYKRAEGLCGNTERFLQMMEQDKETMVERGANEEELRLLRDLFY